MNKYPKLSETLILNEMRELERQGEEVTVFALSQPNDGRFQREVCELQGYVHYLGISKSVLFAERLKQNRAFLKRSESALFAH